MKMKTKKALSFCGIGLVLAIFLALTIVASAMSSVIDLWLITPNIKVTQAQIDETLARSEAIVQDIEEEGIVMVKNNGVLPLSKTDNDKVNVFGWGSTPNGWVTGGSGSGRVVDKTSGTTVVAKVGLLKALHDYGIDTNSALTKMYTDFASERPNFDTNAGTLKTRPYEYSVLMEPAFSRYTTTLKDNAQAYSDTAFVVIGRVSGESSDSPRVQYKGADASATVDDATRTYLEISTEEEDMLKYVGANYENVVVIINSTNTMELGFMDTIDGLDACLVVGATGMTGATAIPKVLYGEVSPSGRLVDTYAYDLSTNASYYNSGADGEGYYKNAGGLYPENATMGVENSAPTDKYPGVAYVDYQEGIYVGYKWYETADAENYWSESKLDIVGDIQLTGYEAVVQYPFGYGLSYTEFSYEVVSSPSAPFTNKKDLVWTIKVKNEGSVAGKEVLQMYYSAPYTDGGIEKSAVNLAAFAKTDLLQPDEEQTITLSFNVEDMASYDCYDKNNDGFKGYEVEAGNYTITLRSDSHSTLLDKNGDEITFNYTIGENYHYDTDAITGNTVENRFTGSETIDGVPIDGSEESTAITYLTRSDFAGTIKGGFTLKENYRTVTADVKARNLYDAGDVEWIGQSSEKVTFGKNKGLKVFKKEGGGFVINELGLELGADYNSPKWDDLLNQISLKDMENLYLHGYTLTQAVASINKPSTRDVDGPNQIGSFNLPSAGTGFPCATVLAQTFNKELVYEHGTAIGEEGGLYGYEGWYGPAFNMHRSPFSGRNYEYYSEDALLSGEMAAQAVMGAKSRGMFSYLKHFVLYESETNRDGLYTWLTEQALREVYMKPFQIAIQEGKATGIMTAYNRIGAVWAGGSYPLLTEVVKNEWGFNGAINTDYCDNHEFMNADQALVAGGTLYMDGVFNNGAFAKDFDTSSNEYKNAIRNATKGNIYMQIEAEYNRSINGEGYVRPLKEFGFSWWILVLVLVDMIAVAGCAYWAFRVVRKKETAPAVENVETPKEESKE